MDEISRTMQMISNKNPGKTADVMNAHGLNRRRRENNQSVDAIHRMT